jgi:hypothetical protein
MSTNGELTSQRPAFLAGLIGDCIVLGVWTGQRQDARLAMVDGGAIDGRRLIRQSKTGAVVMIPDAPELTVRLKAMRRRRESWTVQPLELVVDEGADRLCKRRERTPFQANHYRQAFAEVRAAAANGIRPDVGHNGGPPLEDEWLLKPMPSLAHAHDQDLRDTAVTWFARAGCTLPEICAITGHSLQSATQVLKHYLGSHPELADNAIRKMVEWFEGQQER